METFCILSFVLHRVLMTMGEHTTVANLSGELVALNKSAQQDLNSQESNDTRKYYGLSSNNRCKSHQRTFKCMSACKAMSFQVYRIDWKCRCTCHEMRTTTILPFFKWRTNGTTRAVPKTRSVRLYEIVGTISPPPETEPEPTNATTNFTCPTFNFFTNSTDNSTDGNSTESGITESGATATNSIDGGTTGETTTGEATTGEATTGEATTGEAPTEAPAE